MQIELANKIRRGRCVGNQYGVTRRDENNCSGFIAGAMFESRIEAEAFIAGHAAQARGAKSVPAHDAAVMVLIRQDGAHAVAILDAWIKGWHTANAR